jgi:hypothetical protein
VRATANRTGPAFAKAVRALIGHYSAAETIQLVVDNLNTHTRQSLTDYYGEPLGSALWDRLTSTTRPSMAVG